MHNLLQFLPGRILQSSLIYQGQLTLLMRPINVAVEGVTSLLANLDPSKASRLDRIPARFLKDMANDPAPSLTLTYQASLQQGRIPDEWRKALITPIYKNEDRSCPANYRPISLTCIVCKTPEHIIAI